MTAEHSTGPDPLAELQEHVSFAERTIELLSEEIAAINRKVHEMSMRIESLDRRVGSVAAKMAEEKEEG